MLPRPKPKRYSLTGFMINGLPQPDLMLFIPVKTPHFIHFNAGCDVFMSFKVRPVYIRYLLFFLFKFLYDRIGVYP
jgi:hypothetical protein